MDGRMQFVASRRGDGGTFQGVGISRRTGYKIVDRYQECGIQGLTDRSQHPHYYAHKLPFQEIASGRCEKLHCRLIFERW